jgi:hypothetical protein
MLALIAAAEFAVGGGVGKGYRAAHDTRACHPMA